MNKHNIIKVLCACIVALPLNSCYRSIQEATDIDRQESVLLYYNGFVVNYNPYTRQPNWVSYTLTSDEVYATENIPKIPHHFMEDPNLHLPQASNEDYRGSGWVRGHMARHMDMKWDVAAALESDYMTNICPQNRKMNGGIWLKIENMARKLATKYDSVNIVCGPLFTDTIYGTFGINNIPVPDYYFKTFLVKRDGQYHSIAFICPNNDGFMTPTYVATTVNEVEGRIKTNLYEYLDDSIEEIVEDVFVLYFWDIQ